MFPDGMIGGVWGIGVFRKKDAVRQAPKSPKSGDLEKVETVDDYRERNPLCSHRPRQLLAGEAERPIPVVLFQHVGEVGHVTGPGVGLGLGDGQAHAFRDQVDPIWFRSYSGFMKA